MIFNYYTFYENRISEEDEMYTQFTFILKKIMFDKILDSKNLFFKMTKIYLHTSNNFQLSHLSIKIEHLKKTRCTPNLLLLKKNISINSQNLFLINSQKLFL